MNSIVQVRESVVKELVRDAHSHSGGLAFPRFSEADRWIQPISRRCHKALMQTREFGLLRGRCQLTAAYSSLRNAQEGDQPGLTRSRAQHALEVFTMVSRVVRRSEVSEEQAALVETAALCHDLGHGPFSHALEQALGRYGFDHDKRTLEILRSGALNHIFEITRRDYGFGAEEVARVLEQNDHKENKENGLSFLLRWADRASYVLIDIGATSLCSTVKNTTKRAVDYLVSNIHINDRDEVWINGSNHHGHPTRAPWILLYDLRRALFTNWNNLPRPVLVAEVLRRALEDSKLDIPTLLDWSDRQLFQHIAAPYRGYFQPPKSERLQLPVVDSHFKEIAAVTFGDLAATTDSRGLSWDKKADYSPLSAKEALYRELESIDKDALHGRVFVGVTPEYDQTINFPIVRDGLPGIEPKSFPVDPGTRMIFVVADKGLPDSLRFELKVKFLRFMAPFLKQSAGLDTGNFMERLPDPLMFLELMGSTPHEHHRRRRR